MRLNKPRIHNVPFLFVFAFLIFSGFSGLFSCQGETYKQGAILYTIFCANCHMEDGSGLIGNIPPLAQADFIQNDPARMACIIKYGLKDTIIVNGQSYHQPMAGIPKLTEFEIANIINYINHAWGNDYGYVRMDKIRTELEDCPSLGK